MPNLLIDTMVGSIPIFVGAFKNNLKNLRFYEQASNNPCAAQARNWTCIIAVMLWPPAQWACCVSASGVLKIIEKRWMFGASWHRLRPRSGLASAPRFPGNT